MGESELLSSSMLWPVLLLLLGIFLVFLEVLIPSGGILTVLAVAAFLGSAILAFWKCGTAAGAAIVAVMAIGVPVTVGIAFKLLPKTPFGRKMILPPASREHFDAWANRERELAQLVGKVGRTLTQLRPAGVTEIDGKRIDTLAEGVLIEQGKMVRVIAVQGTRVIVREIEEESLDLDADVGPSS